MLIIRFGPVAAVSIALSLWMDGILSCIRNLGEEAVWDCEPVLRSRVIDKLVDRGLICLCSLSVRAGFVVSFRLGRCRNGADNAHSEPSHSACGVDGPELLNVFGVLIDVYWSFCAVFVASLVRLHCIESWRREGRWDSDTSSSLLESGQGMLEYVFQESCL